MNYLAHSYLTFTDGQIVGQFLEDFIRNKDRFSFPKDIQDGITLHRAIDTFTDSHPAIHEAKKHLPPGKALCRSLCRCCNGLFCG